MTCTDFCCLFNVAFISPSLRSKREGVPEDAAVEYSAPAPIPQRPSPSTSVVHRNDEDSQAKNADWTFIASNHDINATAVAGRGHQRQRSAGSSIDFSPRSPFPNLPSSTSSAPPSHVRARSQDHVFNVPQHGSALNNHFRVHSAGAW
jgi:hypothetical protein